MATVSPPAGASLNLSPKGSDTLRVLAPDLVGYLDLTGSGNETAAHIADDGRLTMMLCSFDRTPLILRLYGRGRVVARDSEAWAELAPRFPDHLGARQIVLLHVDSVQTSCGYAVPVYDLVAERDMLDRRADRKGADGLVEYRREHNTRSIDGLATGLVEGDGHPGERSSNTTVTED